MKEIMKELTTNVKEYEALLENNVIKLIPMVNPDGVIIGNARSSIAGID